MRFLEDLGIRGSLVQWARLATKARTAEPGRLVVLADKARKMGRHVTMIQRTAETRLATPPHVDRPTSVPPSTDWSGRPSAWSAEVRPAGHAPARNETTIGDDVTLYHDCHLTEISLRQIAVRQPDAHAPFALQLDVFRFTGSFLSLVIRAPHEAVKGLGKAHVLRLAMQLETERPVEIFARLNLKNGPNTEQINKAVDQSGAECLIEYDMAYVPFNENWAEHIWFDLFFSDPGMNRIVIHDLILSRHRRAAL
ncbi:MAG: DUF6478 family protein [Paracoccaceae bacterium]|nr:DUF6478 family protein [Paracoccaceae bacterium]